MLVRSVVRAIFCLLLSLAVLPAAIGSQGTWQTHSGQLSARISAAGASLNGHAFIAGGALPGGVYSKQVDVFASASGQWSSLTLSQARTALAAAGAGSIVLFGGGFAAPRFVLLILCYCRLTCASNSVPTTLVDVLDLSSSLWKPTTTLSVARGSLSAVGLGSTLVLFAGGVDDTRYANLIPEPKKKLTLAAHSRLLWTCSLWLLSVLRVGL
jgi:hypothetical protein